MSALAKGISAQYYTVEEWVALEARTGRRYEYHDGQVVDIAAMAGGTTPHARACSNVSGELRERLKSARGDCFTYSEAMRVSVPKYRRYYYPDASVRCGEEQAGEQTGSYVNPLVVVEVVSPSSSGLDAGAKFKHYRSLKSLRDYVLVHLDRYEVQVYSRPAPKTLFVFRSTDGLDASAEIPSLGITLPLAQLYRHVELLPMLEGEAD